MYYEYVRQTHRRSIMSSSLQSSGKKVCEKLNSNFGFGWCHANPTLLNPDCKTRGNKVESPSALNRHALKSPRGRAIAAWHFVGYPALLQIEN